MEHEQLVRTARITGLWYLLLAVSGVMGFMVYHPQVFVSNDLDKTISNLTDHASVSRIRLLFELLIIVSQALAAVWFYKLFHRIDQWAASVLAIWGTVNSVVIMISAVAMNSAIDIAGLSSQPFEQKASSIQLLVSIIENAWAVGGLFFGLWLIPMGYLVITSRRLPVWLGRTLVVGGIGYLVQTFVNASGLQSSYIGMLVIPATIGEFWMIGYLLIYGIRPELR